MNFKRLLKVLLIVLPPLGLLYVLMLACRRNHPWPEGMKSVRYAHRGLHHLPEAPENSLTAFKEAIAHGYGAELDVHLMADGNLAVIHDSSLLRTAGADVMVEDLTAEELKTYRLEGTDEQIPLFEEVLSLFENKTPLVVELKTARGNERELAARTCEVLDQYQVKYCIESFDPRALMWLKEFRPEIVRGQLSGALTKSKSADQPKPVLWVLSHLLLNWKTKPDFIAYDHRYRRVPELKLSRLLYGVQEVSWTVRTEEEAQALEKDRCLIIFENFGR